MDDEKDSVLEGSEHAAPDDRIRGILSQITADHRLRPEESVRSMLEQRLRDAQIELPDSELDELVAQADSDSGGANPNP
jgi:hypothetical protein